MKIGAFGTWFGRLVRVLEIDGWAVAVTRVEVVSGTMKGTVFGHIPSLEIDPPTLLEQIALSARQWKPMKLTNRQRATLRWLKNPEDDPQVRAIQEASNSSDQRQSGGVVRTLNSLARKGLVHKPDSDRQHWLLSDSGLRELKGPVKPADLPW